MTLAVLSVLVAEPLYFARSFAGDAQVHLVFAENAARGRFFEFNAGERVSGETSPGYMLLGATLFTVMPGRWVPVALKILGLSAWYLFCWLVYRVALKILADDGRRDRFWPAVAAIAAALIPGSVYNANVGMENGLFAAAIWLWIDLAATWHWFERDGSRESAGKEPALRELTLAGLLGLACWLRPEGFLVVGLAYTFRLWKRRPPSGRWTASLLIASAIGLASVAFQFAYTGDLVATSILSRRVLTMARSLPLGPLQIDPAFAERLILYLPLTAFSVVGLRRRGEPRSPLQTFLLALFALFFILYSFVTGAAQLARYAIFVMPIAAIWAARGARLLWENGGRSSRLLLALGGLVFIATNATESWYRKNHYSPELLLKAMLAPQERQAQSDDLLDELGRPVKRPIVLAVEAVQLRYELDDRFIVRSLDGRVDRTLLAFVHRSAVDHFGYLRARAVDALLATPNYNRDSSTSLTSLQALPPGGSMIREGLLFRRLPSSVGFAVSAVPSGE